MKIKDIREFFWPMLEAEDTAKSVQDDEDQEELFVADENLDKALDLTFKISDSEDDRRKSIESKASLFLSTISIVMTLIVASNALLTNDSGNSIAINVSVTISFFLAIYTVRTIWFSVKSLQRGNYFVLSMKDINSKGDLVQYKKALIISLAKKTRRNNKTINNKVDNLIMAQEYYKRAIVTICIYSFLILIYCLFFRNPHMPNSSNLNLTKTKVVNSPNSRVKDQKLVADTSALKNIKEIKHDK